MKDLKTLLDNDLWAHCNDCARRVSYFEAAEGNYAAETEARNAAKQQFREAVAALAARGLKWENTEGYLV